MHTVFLTAAAIFLLTANVGFALPVSNCVNLDGTGSNDFNCYLYPSDSSGNPSTTSTVGFATYGIAEQSPGYLVLLDPSTSLTTANEENLSLWDEVLTWPDPGELGESPNVTLCAAASCFPSYATVTANPDPNILYAFSDQTASGIFAYPSTLGVTSTANYYIYTPAAAALVVPEPGSVWLISFGLVGFLAARRKFLRTAS
jgi:hypothetical protein